MLEPLLLTILVVLNGWPGVTISANSSTNGIHQIPNSGLNAPIMPAPVVGNALVVTLAQTHSSPTHAPNSSLPDHSTSLWPWILMGAAGGLGVGIGLYCLGRASVTQPQHPNQRDLGQAGPARHSTASSGSVQKQHRSPSRSKATIAHTPTRRSTRVANQELSITKINRIDTLLAQLRSRDAQKRRQAIWELGQQGTSEAIQPLVNAMGDVDSQQRSLILGAIAEIGTRTLSPMNRALMISLQDTNAEVRKNAIRDLTRVYTLMAQMSQILTHAAMDDDAEVQATAVWALEQFKHVCNSPSLLALESAVAHPAYPPSQVGQAEVRP